MTVAELSSIDSELRLYLQKKTGLISREFRAVVLDVVQLTSIVVQNGFRKALADIPGASDGLPNRSFIEVADVVVEHHLRFVSGDEREIVRKSLLEAYFHAAGPQCVFEPPAKTDFVRALRRFSSRGFAALLLSLHTFNSISLAIQDEIRMKMPDVRSFEIHMIRLESVCRDTVKAAIEQCDVKQPSEYWIRAVARNIEEQLLHVSSTA